MMDDQQREQQQVERSLPPSAAPAGTAAAWADQLGAQQKQGRGQAAKSWRVWLPAVLMLWALVVLVIGLADGSGAEIGSAVVWTLICVPISWRIARRDPQQRLLGLVGGSAPVRAARRQVTAETRVAAQLERLAAAGWIVRHDLHPAGWDYPHNVDHLVVGPPGVVLIATTPNLNDTSGFQTLNLAFDTCVKSQPTWSRIYKVIVPLEGGIAGQEVWKARVQPLSSLNQYLLALPPALVNSEQINSCAAQALWALDPNNAPAAPSLPPAVQGPVTEAPAPPDSRSTSTAQDARWDRIVNSPERAEEPPAPAEAQVDLDRLQAALDRLAALPGLGVVAEQVRSFARQAMLDEERRQDGLRVTPFDAHFVFAGPPGTGKTTIAQQMAEVLFALGRLPRATVVSTNRAGLVAGYIGQTATKTREVIESALGGVLFIDEAYALSPKNNERDFGQEAIVELLEQMETHRHNLAVIIAGYEHELDAFLETNPGLRSRFSRTIKFPNYDAATCVQIAQQMAADGDYVLTEQALDILGRRLASALRQPPKGWANARTVRQIFNDAKQHQSERVIAMPERTREDRQTVTDSDIAAALEGRGL